MQRDLRKRKKRPRLFDWIELRWSTGEQIDGLWVGTNDDNPEPVLARLRDALSLIKRYDPVCYSRLTRDLARVWARSPAHHPLAIFDHRLGACVLHTRFVMAESTTLDLVATVIVHEATHARLWNRNVHYEEALRPRVEAICVRREMAFAARLPNGKQAYERAEQALAWCNSDHLSNDALYRQREAQDVEELRRLGVPDWVVRAIVVLGHAIWFFRRSYRAIARRSGPRATY